MTTRPTYSLFVGVAVAAASFPATWSTATSDPVKPITLPHTPDGYHQLPHHLGATGSAAAATFVVLAATGRYWVTLAVTRHHAGYAVRVAHPHHLTNSAQSLPRRAKTDAGDASLLAHFARAPAHYLDTTTTGLPCVTTPPRRT